jgi:asparagine synthase (glutamine-hydrolysing)
MCGILGKIDRAPKDIYRYDALFNAFRAIKSRGPDSDGTETFHCYGHSVSLIHSRLSIIDPSELGHQPMQDQVSGWWITYNGEIYNYLEVREELRQLGWIFRSSSDTEVLLKAWAQWGLDALQRFNGMFALAAFHPGSGQLWMLRDRFGVKPLAWAHLPGDGIVFSSSVAGIADRVSDEIDIDYCARGARYKVFETAQSGSPFKQVKTVPPGGWVKVQLSEGRIRITEGQWYDLTQAVAARAHSLARAGDHDLLEHCSHLLKDAVRLRLRSDVPVAVSLSGGLDSSTVASLASRYEGKLHGFTYGSPQADSSEGPTVDGFSRKLDIDVTYVWPEFDKNGLSEALERTMAFQEAPFSGLSIIAQNEVYRHARRASFKVLLGGQGGDEIFAGYRKFFLVAVREALRSKETGNALRFLYSLGLMLAHEAGNAREYWQHRHRYRNAGNAGEPRFRLLDWQPAAENLWGDADMSLSGRQIEDIRKWSLPSLLRFEDRNSMGYGVESRLPFLDYRLVELALALPARLKINNGYGKWALRKMTAGIVPDPIRLERKKRGFDVTQAWIESGIGAALRSMVFDNRNALSGYMQPGVDLDGLLSDASLSQDGNLLDEALMLAWLVKPVRLPVAVALMESRR